MTARPLTAAEREIARSVFGDAIDYGAVTINRRKWFALHSAHYVMAPDGHIWVHPDCTRWSEDYGREGPALQGLFIHEMTHVWQAQRGGRWYLPLVRHPFCRYRYRLKPGRPFRRYGIEQQAEIVRHVFLLRRGHAVPGAPPLAGLEALLPFAPCTGERNG